MPNESDDVNFTGGLAAPSGDHPDHSTSNPGHHPATHHPSSKLIFPLFQPPTQSWLTGGRNFGAHRTPTRLHAACDLLNPYQAKIRAVADGVVIQSPYPFYLGTNALEIHHPGVGTVRYGEIDPHRSVYLKSGDHVKRGDVIAHVGRLDGNGWSMLHFELYSGTASGPLTVYSGLYKRRKDLENPTSFVNNLFKHSFGHNS